MNKILQLVILLVVLLTKSGTLLAQTNPQQKRLIPQYHGWYRYQNKILFSDKWEWHSHIDNRRVLSADHLTHSWVFRTQPFFNISSKFSISQGYAFFLQSLNELDKENTLMVPEQRPFQEILIKNDLGKTAIRHRYRLEERFIRKHNGVNLTEGYRFNWRLRYQFQLQRSLFRLQEDKFVHLRLADEIMVNFGEQIIYNTFDQNRFSAAFIINLHSNFDFEAGYSHWFQQRPDGASFINRHIFRVSIFHNIDLRN